MKKLVLLISLSLLLSNPLFASLAITTEISLMNTLLLHASGDPSYKQYGNAIVTLSSSGYKNIKADIAVNAGFSSEEKLPTIELDRITIKARFPSFKVLIGKTRLDWGEGTLFNAGNVLFEDTNYSVPILNNSPVLDRAWLSAITFPLSSFSFLEGAIIVPETGKIEELKGGLRYYNSEWGVKFETGLSFRDESLTPHVSFMGNIGVDASLSASVDISLAGEDSTHLKESITLSSRLFHTCSFLNQDTLHLTLEALYTPFPKDDTLALFLYSIVQYGFSNGISLSLNSIISPLDLSASLSARGSWNIFEGVVISGAINTAIGESGDIFSYDKGMSSFSIGLSSLF